MEEMKTVTMEVSGAEDVTLEFENEDTSSDGPSKGFVALAVGAIAAVAVGAAVVIERRKRKKVREELEEKYDYFEEAKEDEIKEDAENNQEPVKEEKTEKK